MLDTHQSVLAANATGQDRACIIRHGPRVILAVADGAGGRSGGAEAADLAISLIRKHSIDLVSSADCKSLLAEMDRAISRDPIAGETTCVVAVASSSGIVGASVGDSAALLVSSNRVNDLTGNQTRKPFLGAGCALITAFESPEFSGTLLLASDGLTKYAPREGIAAVLQGLDLKQVADELAALVRYPSGALPDDVAIVLCRPLS